MLEQGRIALLFDGFDELAQRVTYEQRGRPLRHPAAARPTGQAKVVVTSRTQHFESDRPGQEPPRARSRRLAGRRLCRAGGLRRGADPRLPGQPARRDQERAERPVRADRRGPGPARPVRATRACSASSPSWTTSGCEQIRSRHGRISAAELYRELVDFWLLGEAAPAAARHGPPSLDEMDGCTRAPSWRCGCGVRGPRRFRRRISPRWPAPWTADRARVQRGAGRPRHRLRQPAGARRGRRLRLHPSVDHGVAGRGRRRRPSGEPRPAPSGAPDVRLDGSFFIDLATSGRAAGRARR